MTTTIKTVNAATSQNNTATFYICCDGDIFDTKEEAEITGPISGVIIVDGFYCGSLDDMRSAAKEKFLQIKDNYTGKELTGVCFEAGSLRQ